MTSILLAALLTAPLVPHPAGAETVDDGLDAYNRSDHSSAMRILYSHAQAGDSTAQRIVGRMYQYGEGVAQDYFEAVRWYRRSADQGYSYAYTDLGAMYHMGTGVEQDYAQAMQWYLKAAAVGEMHGMRNIGVLYEEGYGVEKNLVMAFKFFALSQRQGNTEAGQKLESVRGGLSKWQLAEACSALAKIYEEGNSFGLSSPDSAEAQKWYREAVQALPKKLGGPRESRADSTKQIESLQSRVQELESELANAREAGSASDSGAAGAAARVNALDSELAQANARASALESQFRSAQVKLATTTAIFAAVLIFSPLIMKAKIAGVTLGARLFAPPAAPAAPAGKNTQLIFRSDGLPLGAAVVRVQKRTFVLTNTGERNLEIAATGDKPWLKVEPAKIVIEPGGEEVFTVSLDRRLVDATTADGAIELRGQGDDFRREIRVEA